MQGAYWITVRQYNVNCPDEDLFVEHRHIDVKEGQWGVAVIHSIWERGSDEDILALIREVKRNPKAASAVRRAIPHSRVYGWPRFFKLLLEKTDAQG